MTRLGIDTAAVVASRRAAVKQDRMSIATRTVPHEHSPSSHAQTIDGPMSDVENFTNSPVTGFSHGLQRFTSNTSERPLSRVAEEGGERELENREADEISLGSDSELEEELEEEGLYAGSYSRLVALYSLAPITFLILFVVFALVPSLVQHDDWKGKYPYTPYLPFPIAELLVSGGAWSISYTVNDFIFRISVWICNSIHTFLFYCTNPPQHILPPLSVTPPILVSGLAYATLSIFLRLSTIPILLIPQGSLASSPTWHEPVFGRVWWAGLGWAVFEALAGIKQGYQGISLYRDVLIDISKLKKELEGSSLRNGPGIRGNDGSNTDFTNGGAENSDTANHTSRSSSLSTPMASPTFVRESQNHQESSGQAPSARDCLPRVTSNPERQPLLSGTVPSRSRESIGNPYLGSTPFAESMETEVERDLDQLIAIKKRDDLERVYGIPFIVRESPRSYRAFNASTPFFSPWVTR
ncbi:hypothetical protein E1B28_013682 [Marasmius oreades]|uniref:Uncharacterized protein n=1 Tax=Marasmius oreades TaxID=181124 RepID=A0A9P7UQ52_9AGAR|nr:uncharacterized protein E1B28_013682 [Marasmius oreades]KAG7087739.1 hypothetical protein E1B28_013682 [Marasmius oreades]